MQFNDRISSKAQHCRGIGSVSQSKAGASESAFRRQRLRQRVARWAIKVEKLCSGRPSDAVPRAFLRRAAALGIAAGHGVAGGDGGVEVLVLEQQRRERPAQVPLDGVGEDAQEQMRTHALFDAVVDGADAQVDGLEAPEGAHDVGEVLVRAHDVLGRQAVGGLASAHDLEAVHRRLALDARLAAVPREGAVGDVGVEVLADLEAALDPRRLLGDLGG